MHLTLASEVDLVLRSLDLPVAQAIGFVDTRLNLLLDGERHLERHGSDGIDEEFANRGVDRRAHDALPK
jgi:hypothetical protein